MTHEAVQELLHRAISQGEYGRIRKLWLKHSIAEDNRDIPGLMSTLTDDCVYEMSQTGDRWERHEGATAFYTGLLSAFPDVVFDLTNIVIGPQGVVEEANATGTHTLQWLKYPPTGKFITMKVIIFFPWDPAAGLFTGERIYLESDAPLRGE